MKNIKVLFSNISLEFKFLFIPSIFIFFFIFFLFILSPIKWSNISIFGNAQTPLDFSATYFLFTLILSFIYIFYIFLFRKITNNQKQYEDKKNLIEILQTFISLLPIFVLLTFSLFLFFQIVPKNLVANLTIFTDSIEKYFFGNLLSFKLIKLFGNTITEKVIFFCYNSLFLVIGLSIFTLSISKDRLKFKKLIFCLIIAFILAFPFWVLFPIVSPSSIYFSNNVVNQREIPKEINLSQTFNYYNNAYNQSVVGTKENYLAVSSFPSMHVTWGIIAIWFLIEKKKYLNMLFLSWLIIEIIATIYTMQHYAIDTMFGILFAFLIIKLVDKIFKK